MKKVISMIVAIAMLVTMFSTVINLGTASAASHDYDRALDLALQFFDANKCGPDAAQDNVFSWRGACHTSDKGSSGEDLTGGYHDAGDHVKFGLPQAYSAAMLGWAMYEYKNVIDSTGNTEKLYATLKYFTDYILKCHPNANLFYHQVGDGGADHSYWGAPEKQTGSRPVKVVNSNTPGTDVAGEASAALTIMYLNYKDIDSTYANKCLAAAKTLYALAKSKIGAYDEGNFYRSNAIYDDLAWAATWLYIAGGSTDDSLLAEAETYCVKPKLNAEDPLKHIWTMCWDDVYLPTYVKLAQITGKTIYKDAMKYTFNYWQTLSKTPGGLMYLNNWGALRYASAEAALVFMYNNLVEKDQTLVEKFRTQLDYALGTNPLNMSYVIGYGSKWPKHPHHRAAHPEQGASEAKYQLTGALVGGPSNSDQFSDSVNEYQYTEVAIDYNASFMLALTSYLGTTMASVPTPTKTTTVPTPTKTNSTNGFTVAVDSVEGENGTTVTVPVRFANVPSAGVTAADMTITYDASKLEYVSGEAGSIVTNPTVNYGINKEEDGKLKVLFLDNTMSTGYISQNGIFTTLTFKVVTSSKVSTLVNVEDATFGDKTLSPINATINAGTISLNGGGTIVTPTKTTTVPTPTKTISTTGFTVAVDSVEGESGKTISVPVSFIKVPSTGVTAADMTITYDATKLEYVSGSAGSIVTDPDVNYGINKEENGKLKVLFLDNTMSNGYISQDGVFTNLTFKVITSSKVSTLVNVVDATFGDKTLTPINATILAGTIALNGGGDIVTPTPVKTATPTKTAVVQTPTPIVSSNLKVEFYNTNAQADSNSIYPKFKLTNTGSSAINLSDVKLRYYFTVDGDKEQTFWCDWSPVGSSNVTGTFVKMSPTAKGADQYLEISFSSGAGTLAANTSIEVQGRFAKADWTNYNQADDYSFNSSASSFTSWDKVTAYISGARVWGVEPDNGVTPTPTKVVTPTPTKVVTPNPNSMTVKVNTVQAEAGSTVTVPITISKVSSNGLSAADLAIKYDASKLEYVSGEAGSIIINPDVNFGINKEEDGLIKALFLDNTMATEYIREDGVFINLTFKVKSTAAVGTSTEVSIDGSATFGDRELKQIATSLVSGKVEVIDGSAMKLVIGKVSGKAGTEVEVPVTLEGVADGVSAADMTIAYDASKLEYVSGEAGSIVINPDVNFGINKEEDGKLKVLFLDNTMATEYIKEDGVFINLTFKIKSTATGTAAVSNGDVATFGGRSLQQLSVVITDGSVTVGDNPSTPTKTSTTTPVKTPTTTPVKTPVADGFNFIIDTVEGNPGSSVSVPVRFVGVPAEGISAADMAIAYDASKLEYISGDAGSIVTNPTVNFGINKEEDGKLKLLFLDNTMDKGYISQDGIFVTLNFNIKSSVAVGAKAEISVTDTATFGNNKLQPVDATITNGAVKVVKVEDPNGFKVVIATVDGATGSQAVVPVSFVNVPSTGISATDMMITYDAAKIEYVDCEVGSIVTNPVVNFAINKEEDGILRVLFLDNTMATQFISEDGIFASLIFKVIGTDGLATISVGDATFGDKTLKQVDAVLVAGGVNIREASEGFKVSGYINPDFVTTSTTAPIVNAGFTVELVGAAKSAVTDGNGYFEIDGVAAGTYTIKITKANYLTREIASVSVTADKQLSTTSAPILMWAGDMEIGGVQDGAINLEDILEICKSFNTSSTDAKYQVGSDLNRDGAVSLEDVMIVAKHFNKISADY